MSNVPIPTKAKLLELLKKNNFTKESVAQLLGTSEKSVRRWCKKHKIDTDFERKKSILEYEPVVVIPKTSKVEPSDGKTKLERCFVFSDCQIPYHSKQAVSIAIQRCKDYKPTHCIIIGDFLDYAPLLGKSSQRHPTLVTEELKSLDLEFLEGSKVLNEIEKSLPKNCVKIFLKGNHEDRADQIISKPDGDYWKKHLDIDMRLGLTQRGWKVYRYNDSVQLGHLHFTHGSFYNTSHAQKHALHYMKNLIYGHTHQIQVFTASSPVRELPVYAASIGCLADVNPEWIRQRPNSWDHAFCEVDFLPNGDFFPSIYRIIRGKVLINGKLYQA